MDKMNEQKDTIKTPNHFNKGPTGVINSLFPTVIVLTIMVGIVIVTTMITGYKIFSLEREKAEIELRLAKIESYENVTRDIDEKENQLPNLKNEVPELEARRNIAEEEYSQYREKQFEADISLQKIMKKTNEVEANYFAKLDMIGELTANISNLQKRESELTIPLSERRTEHDILSQEITQTKNDLSAKSQELSGVISQLELQRDQVRVLAEANSDFSMIISNLNAISSDLGKAKNQAEASIIELSSILPKHELTINTLNSSSADLNETNRSLESISSSLSTLNSNLTRSYNSLSSTSTELNITNRNLESISSSLSNTNNNLALTYESANSADKVINSTSNKLSEVTVDVNDLLSVIQQSKEAFAYLEQTANSNSSQIYDKNSLMLSKYTVVDKNMEEVLSQLESVKASIVRLESKINEIEIENE